MNNYELRISTANSLYELRYLHVEIAFGIINNKIMLITTYITVLKFDKHLKKLQFYISHVDCTPGYYGPNCVEPCRYPGYGSGCQKECSCNMTVCNHVNGCFEHDLDGTNLKYNKKE